MSIVSSINPFALRVNPGPVIAAKREDIDLEVGSSNFIVDGIRSVLAIPYRVLFLNSNINSGDVSPETIEKVKDYLHENGLHDVFVSVNQYKPQKIWYRTFTNPRTSVLSKLIMGVIRAMTYTLAIPKLTGQYADSYDPLSNTVNLSTNDLSFALHECGHAKDFNSKENPMLYNGVMLLAPAGLGLLGMEYQATKNAIDYLEKKGETEEVKDVFKSMGAPYATYVANAVLPFLLYNKTSNRWECLRDSNCIKTVVESNETANLYILIATVVSAVAIGHIAGRYLASRYEEFKSPSGEFALT